MQTVGQIRRGRNAARAQGRDRRQPSLKNGTSHFASPPSDLSVTVLADFAFNAFRSRAHAWMRYARAQRPVRAAASFCRASFCRALKNTGAKKMAPKQGP